MNTIAIEVEVIAAVLSQILSLLQLRHGPALRRVVVVSSKALQAFYAVSLLQEQL